MLCTQARLLGFVQSLIYSSFLLGGAVSSQCAVLLNLTLFFNYVLQMSVSSFCMLKLANKMNCQSHASAIANVTLRGI